MPTFFKPRDVPRIVITDHAVLRIKERLGCAESKIQKIVRKAFVSREKIEKGDIPNEREYLLKSGCALYKKFMGLLYVFEETSSGIFTLITVSPVTGRRGGRKMTFFPVVRRTQDRRNRDNKIAKVIDREIGT